MVKHIPIVGGLLIAQGALETIAGAFYALMGPMMRSVFENLGQQQMPPNLPPGFANYMGLFYVVAGVLVFIAGLLKVVAGVRNLRYRGRVLGIIALSSGLFSVATCYCFPTALLLLVYGFVVYLRSDVRRAFEMGSRGCSPQEINAALH